jgi:ubiquinone/menaquinone biosynthesis C-methylase UbiE
MNKWSRYVQSPRFLEISRKYYFSAPDTYPLIRRYLGVTGEMQILDVGCGTGFFTRLLAEGLSRGKVYGLDIDGEHIAAAREIGRRQGLAGRVEFIQGDALSLPFEDGAFDLVASCTFFNVVKNPRAAMGEMLRVVRDGGVVSSLDSMTLGNQTWHRGYYPELPWLARLEELEKKIWRMYQAIYPLAGVAVGLPTSEIPHFFAASGLKKVRVHALGRVFSLSNAILSPEERQEYITALYLDGLEKLNNYLKLPQSKDYLTREEVDEYAGLLMQKRDYLLSEEDENIIWEWYGGANLLTVGDVVKKK